MTDKEFEKEKKLIESVLEPEEIMSVTASSENSIDVKVTPDEYIQSYVRPMLKIGYELQTKLSSTIKLVFHKATNNQIQLFLQQSDE